MENKAPQPTPHEDFRLTPGDPEILLEARAEAGWIPPYRLSREIQLAVDYEPRNWFTSTHPSSIFRQHLMVARTTPQARHALLDNRLTRRSPDGRVARRTLSADGIEQALIAVFGLPVEPAWRPLIEKAAAAA